MTSPVQDEVNVEGGAGSASGGVTPNVPKKISIWKRIINFFKKILGIN